MPECPNHIDAVGTYAMCLSEATRKVNWRPVHSRIEGLPLPLILYRHIIGAIKIILLWSARDIVILVALLLLQLNYYSMEAEFTTQKLVFSKTNFAASIRCCKIGFAECCKFWIIDSR